MLRRSPPLVVLVAVAGACSSSASSPSPSTSSDGPGATDAPASAFDAPPPGAADGPPVVVIDAGPIAYTCPETLDAYCSSNPGCVRRSSDLPTCGSHLIIIEQCGSLLAYS